MNNPANLNLVCNSDKHKRCNNSAPFAVVAIILTALLHLDATAKNMLRDPTQPQSYNKEFSTIQLNNEIKIDAIFAGKDHKVVIIGDSTFTIGDKILDSTIIDIDSHAVRFKNENGEFEVAMPYSNVKSPLTTKKKNARENLE